MRPRSPWWMCCGWWSPWCVLDTLSHAVHLNWNWLCEQHDRRIMATVPNGEDWLELLDGSQLMHHFETLEPAEVVGPPKVVVESTWSIVTGPPQTWAANSEIKWTPK